MLPVPVRSRVLSVWILQYGHTHVLTRVRTRVHSVLEYCCAYCNIAIAAIAILVPGSCLSQRKINKFVVLNLSVWNKFIKNHITVKVGVSLWRKPANLDFARYCIQYCRWHCQWIGRDMELCWNDYCNIIPGRFAQSDMGTASTITKTLHVVFKTLFSFLVFSLLLAPKKNPWESGICAAKRGLLACDSWQKKKNEYFLDPGRPKLLEPAVNTFLAPFCTHCWWNLLHSPIVESLTW